MSKLGLGGSLKKEELHNPKFIHMKRLFFGKKDM
jgi:hypothetical protein